MRNYAFAILLGLIAAIAVACTQGGPTASSKPTEPPHRNTPASGHPYIHSKADSYSGTATYYRTDPCVNSAALTLAHSQPDPDPNPRAYIHANSGTHAHTDSDPTTDSHAKADSDAYLDAYPGADTNPYSGIKTPAHHQRLCFAPCPKHHLCARGRNSGVSVPGPRRSVQPKHRGHLDGPTPSSG